MAATARAGRRRCRWESFFIAHLPGHQRDPLAVLYEVRHVQAAGAGLMTIGAHRERILVTSAGGGAPPASVDDDSTAAA